mmetsp:Transcript_22342/g.32032  ORF Transcript_22342/g.32032 Transcript_22342/m.32032 type:complete len:90 (-) Transcript_22342:92-361(-)
MLALQGDRAVGNFLEFAILFLPLLWIHALFVDPTQSFMISTIYTVSRAMYPFFFTRSINGMSMIFISTLPGYVVMCYLLGQIALKFAFV